MWDQKTTSFEGFPKFWREPNLREWWVGVKKFSKRMAMQSNCDGSSREFESQKNNELSAASGERIKILILMFLPPRRVVEPIV